MRMVRILRGRKRLQAKRRSCRLMAKSGIYIILFAVIAAGLAAEKTEDDFGGWPGGIESGDGGADTSPPSAGEDGGDSGFGGGFGNDLGASEPFSLYGYVRSTGRAGFDDPSAESGASMNLRIKGDWQPESRVSAHIEINYEESRGYLNPYGFSQASGIDELSTAAGGTSVGELQAENPQDDFHSLIEVDHAWGLFSVGPLDLKAGKMPVAWGSAYVFNPTDRVNRSDSFSGGEGEETPGSTGILPSLQLPGPLSLSGYWIVEDRERSAPAGEAGGNIDNYPFGVKLQGYAGGSDWSLSLLKEVLYLETEGGYRRDYCIGGDLFSSVADGGIYFEGVCRIPMQNERIDFEKGPPADELIEASLGIEYHFGGGVTLRGEYFYYGPGAVDKDDYRPAALLSGEQTVLGRNYLFAMADRTFFDYLELSIAGLCNLNDLSFLVLPEASYELTPNVQLKAAGMVPLGEKGSEMDGRLVIAPGSPAIDLVSSGLSMELKVSF